MLEGQPYVDALVARVAELERRGGEFATILTQQLAALDALKAAVFGLLNQGSANEDLHSRVDGHFESMLEQIRKGPPHQLYVNQFLAERTSLQAELQPAQAALHQVPDVRH